MTKKEMHKWLETELADADTIREDDSVVKSAFLGTYMALDPCGRYHHILSPNGATKRCVAFWDRLEEVAGELDAYITSGEGDPCDVFIEQVL